MKHVKLVLLLLAGGLVSACASTDATTRNAPFQAPAMPFVQTAQTASAPALLAAPVTDVRVENIAVRVPQSLTVSEANLYLPKSDIVWREDPIGDRHAQVATIFQSALERGTAPMDGAVPVTLDVEVRRFHALTEKARYTTGGVHNITFILTVRHAETGAQIAAPRMVRADLEAYGGQKALAAEARGQTQKVRITDHLAEVIRQELTTRDGFKNPRLGILQAMNQL